MSSKPLNFSITPYGSNYGWEDIGKCPRGRISKFIEAIPFVKEFIKKISEPEICVVEESKDKNFGPAINIEDLESHISSLDSTKKYEILIFETVFEHGRKYFVRSFKTRYLPDLY
jgi:hypothetical protein